MVALPLDGVVVAEFAQFVAGPFCGSLLGDAGATVWKIEPPGGDAIRHWPPTSNGVSSAFLAVNRNKMSVELDVKSRLADRELALSLAARADVLIENSRPGVMDRLGLGFEAVSAINPGIVYCSITGYGQTGPYRDRPAMDLTIQGMAGVMAVTGSQGQPPIKSGVPFVDFAAATFAVNAILLALMRRRETGLGTHIDVSLLEATMAFSSLQIAYFGTTHTTPPKLGSAHPSSAPYQCFRAANGYFVLAAPKDAVWVRVAHAFGAPELLQDPRFATNSSRVRHQDELAQAIEARSIAMPLEHWVAALAAEGIPAASVNDYGALIDDEHVKARDVVFETSVSPLTSVLVKSPVRFDGDRLPIRSVPSALGADNDRLEESIHGSSRKHRVGRTAGATEPV